jgi:hypothetical protein
MKNLDRGNPSGSTRRNFLKGAGALGLTVTAGAGRAHGQSVINEDGSVSTNTNTGAAKWISPSAFVVSSLETGHIGTLTAWGGDEYGYAYTYTLSGAPAGVAIDADTGRLNVASALTAGDKTFTITATNREDKTKTAHFTFTLHVLTAVTSGTPTSSQIRHATFDPHSGTWGTPTGNDWTAVFNAMQKAILSLQTTCNAVHDESLRVKIPLHRGTTYQYTNNRWVEGIQYLQIYDTGSGALPIMQNVISDRRGSNPYSDGPWNIGHNGSINHQEGIKARCATIATVAAGSTMVTLLNAGDASKIKQGRWHQVMGKCIQIGGFPPNEEFIDYVKVTNVSGTTVTLDRPLRHSYDQTWYENPNDDQSLGMARLVPFDTGGTGGYIPADPRCFIRCRMTNIHFLGNPNYAGGLNTPGGNIVYISCAIDWTFDGCTIPNAQLSMSKHFYLKGCTATDGWEPDKECETITFDGGVNAPYATAGTTGFDYVLFRNHHAGLIQVSPRQLRGITTWFDGSADGSSYVNGKAFGAEVTVSYNGPLGFWEFGSAGACQFSRGLDTRWMYPGGTDASLVIGTDATWNGNQLRIPKTFASFQQWLIWTTVGTVLALTNVPPYAVNWGYVSRCTSPGDGSALWLNVVWVNGSKPTSGRLYLRRARRLFFASGNTLNKGCTWASPKFLKETATGCETGWYFPTGYPAILSG